MIVKEFLIQLRPLLITHEWATMWSKGTSTELQIDVEHNHTFHSLGKFSCADVFRNTDYYILEPFEHAYYHGYEAGKPYEFCVLDLEVYRWKLAEDKSNNKLWHLEIETHQT